MGRLVYSAIASLDGYVDDESGGFEWAAPDDEVHAFVNEQERSVGTYLLGRRMYEVMTFWEGVPEDEAPGSVGQEYAGIWRSADKVLYSTTVREVSTLRTRLEHTFDTAAVRAFVDASPKDVSVGGPTLAAAALRAGIVDQIQLYRVPSIVGGGTPALPDGIRLDLRLLDSRTFEHGTTWARYAVR